MKRINKIIEFCTDAGAFVITCPDVANEHVHDEIDWFVDDAHDDFTQGRIALIGLGGDGYYKVRLSSANLTKLEKKYAREVVHAGFECKCGEVFIGFVEALPGGDEALSSKNRDLSGEWLAIDKGKYHIDIYSIDTSGMSDEPEYNEDKAAEIVILVKPQNEPFIPLKEAPTLFSNQDTYLFESKSKRKKPEMGHKGFIKVYNSDTTGLFPGKKYFIFWSAPHEKYNFPNSYSNYVTDIKDVTNIEGGDELIVISTELDEKNKKIYCEVVEKVNKSPKGLIAKIKSFFSKE